jgi:2-oxo-3-hexenedioate decarboxylase
MTAPHLAELLAADPLNPPLAAGEVVTTGRLTRAFPAAAGEVWTTELTRIPQARVSGSPDRVGDAIMTM